MTVRIVTDSTADIPLEQAKAAGITVVPLTVFFGDWITRASIASCKPVKNFHVHHNPHQQISRRPIRA